MSLASMMSSAVGGVQKAFIVIHNTDASKTDSQITTDKAKEALQKSSAAATAKSLNIALKNQGAQNTHVMQVQYNPSSLTIQATAEAVQFSTLQENVDVGIPRQNMRPPMVMLSVELIFDAMNPADASMMDKLRLSAGSAASDIAGVVKNIKDGGYTVQPQTEGLLAVLLRQQTRLITFRWAEMAFTGQLVEAEADYTMFSVSGKPIRSKITLNIAQLVESEADFKYWDKVLTKAFDKEGNMKMENTRPSAMNLLNLDAF